VARLPNVGPTLCPTWGRRPPPPSSMAAAAPHRPIIKSARHLAAALDSSP
jgi:hypothetical protein